MAAAYCGLAMTQSAISDGLLAKWRLFGAAVNDPRLSACDQAVLWQICERYNAAADAAWPSLDTMALDTGRSRRAVQNSVKRLEKDGFIEVIHGGRKRSNRYKPLFEVRKPTALPVEQATSEGREAGCLNVGKPTAPEPSYKPGQEAGFIRGPASAGGAASALPPALRPPAGPGRAGDDCHRFNERQYKEFWAAYPPSNGRRTGPVEDYLDELIKKGADFSAIVAGAAAYRASLEAKRGHDRKFTRHPLNWLKQRGWLDEYPVAEFSKKNVKAAESYAAGRKRLPSKSVANPFPVLARYDNPNDEPKYLIHPQLGVARLVKCREEEGPLAVGDQVKAVYCRQSEEGAGQLTPVSTIALGQIIEDTGSEFRVLLNEGHSRSEEGVYTFNKKHCGTYSVHGLQFDN